MTTTTWTKTLLRAPNKKLLFQAFQLFYSLIQLPYLWGDASGAPVPAVAHLTEASFLS
jgi:hypothetical protein